MSDEYPISWACPRCGRVNPPRYYVCPCTHWPPQMTTGTEPVHGSGITWFSAEFERSLSASLTENAAVYQALADYDKGADSE